MNEQAETRKAVASPQAIVAQRRNRTQMMLIIFVALLTLGGSYAMFYVAKNSSGWGTTNNGMFVDPPVNIEQLGWQVDGNVHRWWLWIVASQCGDICLDSVRNMRAAHILLNREAERVRRGYTGAMPLQQMERYPKLARVMMVDRGGVQEGVYIVDPNGNLVFFYPLDTDPESVLQDLRKLLKVSQIG